MRKKQEELEIAKLHAAISVCLEAAKVYNVEIYNNVLPIVCEHKENGIEIGDEVYRALYSMFGEKIAWHLVKVRFHRKRIEREEECS